MEERWDFLVPWCDVLYGRIRYYLPNDEGILWDTQRRLLHVDLPTRGRDPEEDYHLAPEDEAKFQREFQREQEALALLSVVAHVDYNAWRYLLETHCGLYSRTKELNWFKLGQKWESSYGDEILPRFQLRMHVKATAGTDSGSFNSDLVQFCGPNFHDNPSEEYIEALAQIAAPDPRFTAESAGVDVKVPVRVSWSGPAHLLKDIWRAEQTIRDQWQEHGKIPPVPPGSLRCTFELEPMEANFGHITGTELAELLEAMITSNVRFSQFCLQEIMEHEREVDKAPEAKKFSALSISIAVVVRTQDDDQAIDQVEDEGEVWGSRSRDDVALVAFFSKRARACSSLKSLALMRIGSISIEDMEAFTAVMNSDHPEEELIDRPRGLLKPRDATLKSGAPILWRFDDQGEPNLDWDPITFDAAVQFVRTFSDDGTSTWVDAIIPGLGRCQVLRDDLEFQPATSDYNGDLDGGVTSLQIGFAENERDLWEELVIFLATVGSSLTFLGLDYHEDGLEDILRHCPKLQELTFCGGFAFFRFNFSDYEGEIDEFDYEWRDLEELAEALSDNTTPLARCLRRMRVRLDRIFDGRDKDGKPVYDVWIETILAAFYEMLQVNQRLEYLDVHLPPSYHDCIDEFRQYHLKPIGRPREPLSSECKLSLLSVISSSQKQLTPGTSDRVKWAGREFDQFSLSNIFEYAAPSALRQVFARKAFEGEFRNRYENGLI
ncbi:hypothetical protein PHYSODRAFT_255883 [Phytophthora sojae]|uniref:Uncharacterized protein n=1 Tax=Phytophthora sojae (strain P6497) TaxID=1094619 RepID=G5A881_PHYSP|nr:hypothetical protein PHYSODRAFT_255883 [Phytophthora sojae]EGZ08107.1 hypothetical protein PHYSODRAFT_255883 [Phytophthora sojae]|eukprot:XP_009536279.1 hypothetical protein PHYSODRAFT_255883 [Phytophthora sojae]